MAIDREVISTGPCVDLGGIDDHEMIRLDAATPAQQEVRQGVRE